MRIEVVHTQSLTIEAVYCGPVSSGCIHQIRLLGHSSFRNRSIHPSSPPRVDCPSPLTNFTKNTTQHHQDRPTQPTSFPSTSSWKSSTRGTYPCDIIGADKNRAIPLSNRHVLPVLYTDQNARVPARLRTQNDEPQDHSEEKVLPIRQALRLVTRMSRLNMKLRMYGEDTSLYRAGGTYSSEHATIRHASVAPVHAKVCGCPHTVI
jgi:hypothetical protein